MPTVSNRSQTARRYSKSPSRPAKRAATRDSLPARDVQPSQHPNDSLDEFDDQERGRGKRQKRQGHARAGLPITLDKRIYGFMTKSHRFYPCANRS